MAQTFQPGSEHRHPSTDEPASSRPITGISKLSGFRFRFCTLAAGVCALLWLLLRTGTKPSRLGYPCQQSAFGMAAAAFGVPLVAALLAGRAGLLKFMRTGGGKVAGGFIATLAIVLFASASYDSRPLAEVLPPRVDYHPDIYLVNDVRGLDPELEPVRFGGVDDLVTLMGMTGFKWHRSPKIGVSAGPGGLIDNDDVIVLKVNGQWAQRGGTNTDVLRGVLRKIVEHPDGFAGEIVVADNGQGWGDLDRLASNAEDRGQSMQDVADEFIAEGWTVSTRLWDGFRNLHVDDYVDGNYSDGYVLSAAPDPETDIIVSYPKFVTINATYISYKYGIWDRQSETYDADRLVVINMPVLKTHSIYGVTGAVKNHMGVVTQGLSTDSHDCVEFGGLGSFLAEVRLPDLTILDCIWVLAHPGSGPRAYYDNTSRRDQLVAGTDPVALDMWAVKHILMPQIIANGYESVDYGDTQDPDNPASVFRNYLDRSMSEMLRAGIDTTNDYDAVNLHVWGGDADRDGDLDLRDVAALQRCFSGPGEDPFHTPPPPECLNPLDFDDDGDIDLADVTGFQGYFTGPSQPVG